MRVEVRGLRAMAVLLWVGSVVARVSPRAAAPILDAAPRVVRFRVGGGRWSRLEPMPRIEYRAS